MDFKELMNLATQNKTRAKKQDSKEVTAKTNDRKSCTSGVSDGAVQAFLAKRELEKKKKSAEEEAARRARIEERLAQSLGTKKKDSAKGTACSQTTAKREKKPSDSSTSLGGQLDRRHAKCPHQPSSKKPDVDKIRQSLEPDNKNSELNSKKAVEKVKKGKRNVKQGPPMDFKALLAMAERNKNGDAKLPSLKEPGSTAKQQGSKEGVGCVKQSGKSSEHGKMLNTAQAKAFKEEKTNGQMHSKARSKLKEKGIPDKTLPSMGDRKVKHDSKQSGFSNGSSEKGLGSKISSLIKPSASHTGKLINPKTIHPSNKKRSMKEGELPRKRHHDTLKRKRSPFEDEMDDFIDDGDGDDVDVSKYIKEIFGYDRTRFRDDDDDLAGMESSYSQIEREESKSAKIARLEDEIEQLKELHELKKERDKLKNKSKK